MSNKLGKVTKVLAWVVEIAHWIAAAMMLIGGILVLPQGQRAMSLGDTKELAVYGFELTIVDEAGTPNLAALRLFFLTGAVLLALMAVVFHDVRHILENSEAATPFQPENVRMVREIGWFLIAVPAAGLVMSAAARLVLGAEIETSVRLNNLLVGLTVLCLSQVFARGMALESDVDGLL